MKPIDLTPELEAVARRVIWFEKPDQAVAEPPRFIAYAMTYGKHEDMKVVRDQFSDDDLIEALDHAPPGIFDGRSWAYWNLKLGRYPAPPMPQRLFPGVKQNGSAASAPRRMHAKRQSDH